jgi:benzoyl-CoA 2,3-dioxygenase component B
VIARRSGVASAFRATSHCAALKTSGSEARGAGTAGEVVPAGEIVDEATWQRQAAEYLPTDEDRARVAELMVAHYEPGDFAAWIAPPSVGINSLPVEYDYVRF